MAHRYKHRIERFTKPEKFEQNCHRNLPGNALQTLLHWNNQLDFDEKSQETRSDYVKKQAYFSATRTKHLIK